MSGANHLLFKGSDEVEIIGPHSANQTCDWLWHYGWLPYNPNVVHSDFHLFGPHMKSMDCKELQQMLTQSQLPQPAYRRLAPISCMLGYNPRYHYGA